MRLKSPQVLGVGELADCCIAPSPRQLPRPLGLTGWVASHFLTHTQWLPTLAIRQDSGAVRRFGSPRRFVHSPGAGWELVAGSFTQLIGGRGRWKSTSWFRIEKLRGVSGEVVADFEAWVRDRSDAHRDDGDLSVS